MVERPNSNLRSREHLQMPKCRYFPFFILPLLIDGAIIQASNVGIPTLLHTSERTTVEGQSNAGVAHPASVTIISPNLTPSLGQLGAYYFETGNQSQVWINLEPQGAEPGPNPFRLNITVAFPGTRLDRVPDAVDVRATSVYGAWATRVLQPVFRLQLEGGTKMDLTAPGKAFNFISSCLDCPLDTVTAQIAFDTLRQVAESKTVGIDALGFTARLKPADLQTLRGFVEIVTHGVQIR